MVHGRNWGWSARSSCLSSLVLEVARAVVDNPCGGPLSKIVCLLSYLITKVNLFQAWFFDVMVVWSARYSSLLHWLWGLHRQQRTTLSVDPHQRSFVPDYNILLIMFQAWFLVAMEEWSVKYFSPSSSALEVAWVMAGNPCRGSMSKIFRPWFFIVSKMKRWRVLSMGWLQTSLTTTPLWKLLLG